MSDIKQVIVVRRDLNMKKGRIASQIAQASMQFLVDNNEAERTDEFVVKLSPAEAMWLSGSFTPIVVGVDSEEELKHLIFQAELADVEVHPVIDVRQNASTMTCAAFGPTSAEELDKLTGKLRLM